MAKLIAFTKKDHGRTRKVVRDAERPSGKITRNPRPIQGKKAEGMRRAKTSAAWSTGETTTAFLLDSDGAEITGEENDAEITVNFFESYSDTNFPDVGDDKTLPVFKDIDGEWNCP